MDYYQQNDWKVKKTEILGQIYSKLRLMKMVSGEMKDQGQSELEIFQRTVLALDY